MKHTFHSEDLPYKVGAIISLCNTNTTIAVLHEQSHSESENHTHTHGTSIQVTKEIQHPYILHTLNTHPKLTKINIFGILPCIRQKKN